MFVKRILCAGQCARHGLISSGQRKSMAYEALGFAQQSELRESLSLVHIRIGIELWLSKVEEQQMQIKKTSVGEAVQLQKDRETRTEWA